MKRNMLLPLVIALIIIVTIISPQFTVDGKTMQLENNIVKTLAYRGESPEITITFAGNPGDMGGPYCIPPLETGKFGDTAEEGYYTNDSIQEEDWINIKLTVTPTFGSITEVWLHWWNATSNIWYNESYPFQNTHGKHWEFNTSGKIKVTPGHKYSFNIWAKDTNNNTNIVCWNKTIDGNPPTVFTRRYVQFCGTPTNISYKPYFYYNTTYSIVPTYRYDRLHHDQGTDGSLYDIGYLLDDNPTDEIDETHCATFVGYWFDETTCVQKNLLQNIYFHIWWHTDNDHIEVLYTKTRGAAPYHGWQQTYNSNISKARSNVTWDDQIYHLESQLMTIETPPTITDNNIYEIFVGIKQTSQNPSIISNRSFTSYLLFNVPDNATLNASYLDSDTDRLSDWMELYITFTNPFLADTDNDGIIDYVEYLYGTDPNNYKDRP